MTDPNALPRLLADLVIGERHEMTVPPGDAKAVQRVRIMVAHAGRYYGRLFNVSANMKTGDVVILCRGNRDDRTDAILPPLPGDKVERQIIIRKPYMRDVYGLLPGHEVTIQPPPIQPQSFRNAVSYAGKKMRSRFSVRQISPGVYTVRRAPENGAEPARETGPFSVERAMRMEVGQCILAVQDAFQLQKDIVRRSNAIPVRRIDEFREMLEHRTRDVGCAEAVQIIVDVEDGRIRITLKPVADAPWYEKE